MAVQHHSHSQPHNNNIYNPPMLQTILYDFVFRKNSYETNAYSSTTLRLGEAMRVKCLVKEHCY